MHGQTIVASGVLVSSRSDLKAHTFIKENGKWHIDFIELLQSGVNKVDHILAEGSDTVLDVIARGKKRLRVVMDTRPFEGASVLELTRLCEAPLGGGYYRLYSSSGRLIKQDLWLCDMCLLVFGDIPERIFVRRQVADA